ncbi:DNA-3-methyladenine glycosylase I [Shewanella sp. 202IG2-18]|uniref:DNA-3-methyladenine glycosylase I n=1 Tax=Parashewanella hymeniacidonis TaxID=2807618 RepID=UPI001961E14D|nr:DNA-3-methyladenine glycosylase I [Parashewanella hymeniacidonis]MBM7074023.1 DNA-3-methyladenine glycosylase I [Parashewanella hymeniacidonis]
MTKEKFETIYFRAAERKGGVENLEQLLFKPLSHEEILQIKDDRWLSTFTMKVFQCGISWKVVRNKWDNFEDHFFGFKPELLLMLSDEQWEEKARDPKIIRHLTKVMTIPANAQMLINASYEHGSFSKLLANWPKDNTTELWEYLKKNGKRLGGNTGAYALRQAGVDTFILSSDVEAYLRNTGIIDSGRTTKKAMRAADAAFVKWHQESGRSLTEISQIIAYSSGENRV